MTLILLESLLYLFITTKDSNDIIKPSTETDVQNVVESTRSRIQNTISNRIKTSQEI